MNNWPGQALTKEDTQMSSNPIKICHISSRNHALKQRCPPRLSEWPTLRTPKATTARKMWTSSNSHSLLGGMQTGPTTWRQFDSFQQNYAQIPHRIQEWYCLLFTQINWKLYLHKNLQMDIYRRVTAKRVSCQNFITTKICFCKWINRATSWQYGVIGA